MANILQNKEGVLRNRIYKFHNEHKPKGKMSKKVPKRIIYNIIKHAENGISAKLKLGSVRRIAKKMNKRAFKSFKNAIDRSDKLFQR